MKVLIEICCNENDVPESFSEVKESRFWCGANWGVVAQGFVPKKTLKKCAFGMGVSLNGDDYIPCKIVK